MTRKKIIKITLVIGLFFLSLGGWLLHLRIHPLAKNNANFIPFISGILSVFCLPFLFWFKRTLSLGYIINGFMVILGTITMAHFSIVYFKGPVNFLTVILNTTLADIAILWGKFTLGKALFDLEFLKSDKDITAKGRFFRYPNMGWWWVHLFGLTVVYALGNIIWK